MNFDFSRYRHMMGGTHTSGTASDLPERVSVRTAHSTPLRHFQSLLLAIVTVLASVGIWNPDPASASASEQVTILSPVAGHVSSPVGHWVPYGGDASTDLAATGDVKARFSNPTGTLKLRVASVRSACRSGNGGQAIEIDVYVDGSKVGWVLYSHLANVRVDVGNTIGNGAVIGKVATGLPSDPNCWTGPHVHLEVRNEASYACLVPKSSGTAIGATTAVGVVGGTSASGVHGRCPSGATGGTTTTATENPMAAVSPRTGDQSAEFQIGSSSGFTPNRSIEITIWNPNGSAYPTAGYRRNTTATASGRIGEFLWYWESGEQLGTYKVRFRDTATNRSVTTSFTINSSHVTTTTRPVTTTTWPTTTTTRPATTTTTAPASEVVLLGPTSGDLGVSAEFEIVNGSGPFWFGVTDPEGRVIIADKVHRRTAAFTPIQAGTYLVSITDDSHNVSSAQFTVSRAIRGCRNPSSEFAGLSGRPASVFRMYCATFLRQPESAGFSYWVGITASMPDVAEAFVASEEFATRYGALDNEQFVELVYTNVMQRDFDQSGYDYWLTLIDRGLDRSEMLLGFAESAEFRSATSTS